jgi:hypothetical protein
MGESYYGRDGQSHTYTEIDCDIKTKISTARLSEEEFSALNEDIKRNKMLHILAILALPAISVAGKMGGKFDNFIGRSQDQGVHWRNQMVQDACLIDDVLRYSLFQCAWKNTVQPMDWDEDLSYEDIINGKYKDLHLIH